MATATAKRQTGHDTRGQLIRVGAIISDDGATGRVTHIDGDAIVYRPLMDRDGTKYPAEARHFNNAGEIEVVAEAQEPEVNRIVVLATEAMQQINRLHDKLADLRCEIDADPEADKDDEKRLHDLTDLVEIGSALCDCIAHHA